MVRQRLMQLVLNQTLEPGDELPSESELAERFGVSKPTVREALRTLAGFGMVQIVQGKRATVCGPSSETLERFFRYSIRGTGEGLREALELRRTLEVEIAALAAERATDAQTARLEKALTKMRAALGTKELWVDADVEFHIALAKGTGNSLMVYLVEALGDVFRDTISTIHESRGPEATKNTFARHERVYEAIRTHDVRAARDAMKVHFDAATPFLQRLRTMPDGGEIG
jgi:GntR family transcriptional repressor for pyruvate dehydrogenase complex